MKSNYGEIFSFANKLNFDDSSILAKLLIMEQEVIDNCPSDNLLEVKFLNVEIFCVFEVRLEVTNILLTRGNVLHWKLIYLQKNDISILKPNVKIFRLSLHI